MNDEWAELRKAQVDGKQLQFNAEHKQSSWEYKVLSVNPPIGTPEDWRVDPKKLYEWQWIFANRDTGLLDFTGYMTDLEARDSIKILTRYNPSMRERI